MIVSGAARLAGVVGWPVGHSLSPRLHGYWLEHYGIDGAYLPLPVRPEAFDSAVRALADLGFRGVNVTLPHKEVAAVLCDEVSEGARLIGAVNTIVIEGGRFLGSNSDGFGFLENLRAGAPGWQPAAAPALVLGAGGAARAVVAALRDAGVPEVRLVNRTAERAAALADEIGGALVAHDWAARADLLSDVGLLVNTTSLGMRGQPELEMDLARLPSGALVTDLVYVPLMTALLRAAAARGNPVVDGLGMLLHQARPGFEAWFGRAPEVTPELRAFVLGPAAS